MDRIPIFAKAGAVIPTQQVLQYSDQAPIDPLTLSVFLADTARYEYYEDDGHTFDYEKGVFAKRMIQLSRKEGTTTLVMGEVKGSYRIPDRSLVVRLVGVDDQPSVVRLSGVTIPKVLTLESGAKGWKYDAAAKCVWLKVPEVKAEMIIAIQ